MISSAQDLVQRLSDWAIRATEVGHDTHTSVRLQIDLAGIVVVATSSDGVRSKATLVQWPEVLTGAGTVPTAIEEMAEAVG
jgi:hypothetical protein